MKQYVWPGSMYKFRHIILGKTPPFLKYTTWGNVWIFIKTPGQRSLLDGTSKLIDDDYPLMKILNGKRFTAHQPEHFQNRIYIVGTCHHYGFGAPFDKTIASYLQQMLNEHNLPYRVENEGQCYNQRYQDIFYNLNQIAPAPDDIIFIYLNNGKPNNSDIPFCDVSNAFDQPHDYREIFTTNWHINELGYKILAERYFKFLTENNFFRDRKFINPPPYRWNKVWYTAINTTKKRNKVFNPWKPPKKNLEKR